MKSKKRSSPESSSASGLFSAVETYGHEQISFWYDEESGYRGIVAIHSTVLGPALGGTRFWKYESEHDALRDVLRLSRGMTFKAAVAGLDLGGGKSVILGDNKTTNREAIFRAHGRHVESLGGRYITAQDVGTTPGDMEFIAQETKNAVGLAGRSGDPSPVTAFGTYRGMQACAHYRYGSDSLEGKTVAVQGVGSVGYNLCKYLNEDGARLLVTDIDDQKVKRVVDEFGATALPAGTLIGAEADVFAPCAMGAIINDKTIKQLKVDIIAGAANNQLEEDRHGDALDTMGVVYAPDYVINGGGVINVNAEVAGWTLDRAHQQASEIYDTIAGVLKIAKEESIPTYLAADHLAMQRLAEARAKRDADQRD